MIRRWALTAVLAALTTTSSVAAARQLTTRTIYATAVDRDERPVPDLTTPDFVVQDGGRIQQISVKPATSPLRVALIVSDQGLGTFRLAAAHFTDALIPQGQLAIYAMVVDFDRLTDYTQDTDALAKALLRLGKPGFINRPTNPRLTEAIVHVVRTLPRDGYRTAVVVMCHSSGAEPTYGIDKAREALRGVPLFVMASGVGGRVGTLLIDSSRESGGRLVGIPGNSPETEPRLLRIASQFASQLVSQYEVSYTRPAGMAPSDRISVYSPHEGVTVRAPSWIAR